MFNQKEKYRMRRTVIIALVLSILSFGMIDSATTNTTDDQIWLQMVEDEKLRKEAEELKIKQHHEDELNRFLNDVGFRESGNRYDITNTWGYMGKYQFGKSTLKGLGFNVTRKEFLNNPQLQEEAMMALLLHNKEKLQTYIDTFDGQTINGMYISERDRKSVV